MELNYLIRIAVLVCQGKWWCMTVNDSQKEDENLNVAEIVDEVYIEVIMTQGCCCRSSHAHKQQIDDNEIKTFMPVVWGPVYSNNSDGTENQKGTVSALLHTDESAGLSRLAKQKRKTT